MSTIEAADLVRGMEFDNGTITAANDVSLVYRITFILLLIVEIPGVACMLFILPCFICHWSTMMTKARHNHGIFLLIVVSFVYAVADLPFSINTNRLGYDMPRTASFCLWWYWLDYQLLLMVRCLAATVSVQRHMMIFNSHWLRQHRKLWLLHYLPLIVSMMYPAVFYTVFIYLYPCTTAINENSLLCPLPCYTVTFMINQVDWIVNTIVPVLTIVAANLALAVRVMYSLRKFHRQRSRTRNRQKKLALQLFAFSSLFIIGWVPTTVVFAIEIYLVPDLFDRYPNLYYVGNSSYFICPLLPFVCLFALPEVIQFVKRRLAQRRPVRARPALIFST